MKTLWVLAVAVLVGACDSDAEPDPGDANAMGADVGKIDGELDGGALVPDSGDVADSALQDPDDADVVSVDAGLPDGCAPSCEGAVCGDDGCGGSCGGCAAGSVCDQGRCSEEGCSGELFECAGVCVDLLTDPAHCGSCRAGCAVEPGTGAVAECTNAECGLTCPGFEGQGRSFDFVSDPENCGGCGVVCEGGPDRAPECRDGACAGPCNEGQQLCHGMCASQASVYWVGCEGQCCENDVGRVIEGEAFTPDLTWFTPLAFEQTTRVRARLRMADGTCAGWEAGRGENTQVSFSMIGAASDFLLSPSATGRRAWGGTWCQQIDVQVPPGLFAVTVGSANNRPVPAFAVEILELEPLPERVFPIDGQLNFEVESVSQVFVANHANGLGCQGGEATITTGGAAALVRTRNGRCAAADAILTPGRYQLLMAGPAAFVLIEPLPVDVHAIDPGGSAQIDVGAGRAHRFDVALDNGAYALTVAGDACRAANAYADIGFAEAFLRESPSCPNSTLYARGAGRQSVYVYGNGLAPVEGLTVAVGARQPLPLEFIDRDFDRNFVVPRAAADDRYRLRVAQVGRVEVAVTERNGACHESVDLGIKILQAGVEIASDAQDQTGRCPTVATFLSAGDYDLLVGHRFTDRYHLSVDVPE